MGDDHNRGGMSPAQRYQMLWDHVNRLTGRRMTMSGIYLSVNAAVVGALAYILKGHTLLGWSQKLAMILLLLAGIVTSYLWTRVLAHLSLLLDWWYERMRELEAEERPKGTLPDYITLEYTRFYKQRPRTGPRLWFTRHEKRLAAVFIGAYLVFLTLVSAALAREPFPW